jgi:dihydrofolate reductase
MESIRKHLARGRRHVVPEFLRLDLVDEIRLSITPIVLGDGLRLFDHSGTEKRWNLKDVVAFKNGFVELLYRKQSNEHD